MSGANFSLEGRTALVIGGTSGIGLEIALGFQASGARVIVASRDASKVEASIKKLTHNDANSAGYTVDAGDLFEMRRFAEKVWSEQNSVDILLNAQGTTVIKPALDFGEDEYARVIRTNIDGVFWACTEFGRRMVTRGSGCIINIGSLSSFRGWPGSSVYAMTKSAVVSLTQSLAAEWSNTGVRVNAIAPGFFMTPLNETNMSDARKALAIARTPMGRFGKLSELVGAAVYLASDAAAFTTGATVAVDGGFLASGL
ncbi:MAG: SDR family NAD(P)-dependent oxidoreductase [Burkholderiaceae bacterium]